MPPNTATDDSLCLRWSGWTHRGRVRSRNEDAFLAVVWDAKEVRYLGKIGEAGIHLSPAAKENFLFAVSDGMGGEKGGGFASKLVVQSIAEWLPRQQAATEGPAAEPEQRLVQLYHNIHDKLNYYGRSYEECRGMGATLSLVWFTQGRLVYGHVGDSRVYGLQLGGELQQISEDDTNVGWMYRKGQLNEREARMHPAKSRLAKVLGGNAQNATPQTGTLDVSLGDRFLLCSDGVVDGLWNHALQRALQETSAIELLAEKLVQNAVSESGRDNVTAITLELAR
jgi:PPM family protein phosphatase